MGRAFTDKERIKDVAAQIGIDGIGFCDAKPLERARRSFKTAIEKSFIPARAVPRRGTLAKLTTPSRHLKGARSIISAYQSYFTGEAASSDPERGTIAAYTRSNHYEDLRLRLERLAEMMERDFTCKTRVFSCYVTLAEKPIACRAGLGFYGKNGVIVTPDHGSLVVLGEIITDLELEPDQELDETCGSCTLCMDACPTGALSMAYFVDRSLCIQYLSERTGAIGPEIREIWRNRFYGCTDCQDVCPYNSNLSPTCREVTYGAVGSSVPLADVLTIGDKEFAARFGDNQIGMRDRNALRRNAIIAAGNSHSETLLPLLATCKADADPMIRQHALWAISKIKGVSAKPALESAMRTERDPAVISEIKTLLDGFSRVE